MLILPMLLGAFRPPTPHLAGPIRPINPEFKNLGTDLGMEDDYSA
jgi:hypothetical protein